MICEGKAYKLQSYVFDQNKENTDQNVMKPSFLQKLKQPRLEKKVSESTYCGSENDHTLDQEALKKIYSHQIANDYSLEILDHIVKKQINIKNFLAMHSIAPSLRSKMIDWMIEVLSSYKMSQESFFKSVQFMDSYLKNETKKQDTKDIHLIGVTCMFSAVKYEEIHPMRLSLIVQKIARRKFSRQQILQKQSKIIETLNFKLEEATLYDVVKHINHEISLKLKPSIEAYFNKILLYLSKMCVFNHELAQKNHQILGSAIYFIGLKTLEQVNKDFCPQDVLPTLSQLLYVAEEKIICVGRQVLQLAKSFSKIYPNLNNLKRFNRFQYKDQ